MKNKIFAFFTLMALVFSLVSCSLYGDVSLGEGKSDYPVSAYRTTMQYYDDFKILQIADLHLGVETNVARELEILKNAIRTEEPDLIVLTGDNFMYASKGIVESLVSTLNEACEELTSKRHGRLAKFTLTFGNHDNQGDYSRYYINEVVSSYAATDGNELAEKKFAAFVDFENDDLFGLTNFYIDLVDDRSKGSDAVDVKYRLHIIDSNTYHFMGTDYDYDIIHDEQLAHAVDIYNEATADKSYIGMAFFHIPLCEFGEMHEEYREAAEGSMSQGEIREKVLCGYKNNGAYSKLREANIVAFFCGHEHTNHGDYIYRASSENVSERAIFSYGVKSTDQLYHDKDVIGYKTVTLRDVSVEEFVSMENISVNFKNFTGGYSSYENE